VSAIWTATPRSLVTKNHAHAAVALQPTQQDQHLHLHGGIQRGRRPSASSNRGSHDSDMAIIARWRSPPESSCG
jgi:hypothetical protein